MKPILSAACFFWKSAWEADSLRSALAALLLAPLGVFAQAKQEVANATKPRSALGNPHPLKRRRCWSSIARR